MPYASDNALDAFLAYVRDNAGALHICSALPSTYAEATSTYSLGEKTSPTIAVPSDRGGGGRECVVSAISDGAVDGDGTATHWAIVKTTATTELLLAEELAASEVVTNGNPFTLAQFAFAAPDPA